MNKIISTYLKDISLGISDSGGGKPLKNIGGDILITRKHEDISRIYMDTDNNTTIIMVSEKLIDDLLAWFGVAMYSSTFGPVNNLRYFSDEIAEVILHEVNEKYYLKNNFSPLTRDKCQVIVGYYIRRYRPNRPNHLTI